jgi:hypothetical protein
MIQNLLAVSAVYCHSQQHVMNTTDFFCDLHTHNYQNFELDIVI